MTNPTESQIHDAVQDERWRGLRLLAGVLVGLAMPILMGTSSWAVLAILDGEKVTQAVEQHAKERDAELSARLKVIEATRYTQAQAQADQRAQAAALAASEKERRDTTAQTMALLKDLAVSSARIEAGMEARSEKLQGIEEDVRELKDAIKK